MILEIHWNASIVRGVQLENLAVSTLSYLNKFRLILLALFKSVRIKSELGPISTSVSAISIFVQIYQRADFERNKSPISKWSEETR